MLLGVEAKRWTKNKQTNQKTQHSNTYTLSPEKKTRKKEYSCPHAITQQFDTTPIYCQEALVNLPSVHKPEKRYSVIYI